MPYIVKMFETERGEKPVREFLSLQDDQTKSKFARLYDLLHEYGPFLGFPHCKKITKSISELRIRGENEVRIFYSMVKGEYILLHAFKKKSQKTPLSELSVAEKRLKILLDNA